MKLFKVLGVSVLLVVLLTPLALAQNESILIFGGNGYDGQIKLYEWDYSKKFIELDNGRRGIGIVVKYTPEGIAHFLAQWQNFPSNCVTAIYFLDVNSDWQYRYEERDFVDSSANIISKSPMYPDGPNWKSPMPGTVEWDWVRTAEKVLGKLPPP